MRPMSTTTGRSGRRTAQRVLAWIEVLGVGGALLTATGSMAQRLSPPPHLPGSAPSGVPGGVVGGVAGSPGASPIGPSGLRSPFPTRPPSPPPRRLFAPVVEPPSSGTGLGIESGKGCERSVWGCRDPGATVSSPEGRYEHLCKQARDTLLTVQVAGTGAGARQNQNPAAAAASSGIGCASKRTPATTPLRK